MFHNLYFVSNPKEPKVKLQILIVLFVGMTLSLIIWWFQVVATYITLHT
jgi:hypothetical protein